MKTKIYSKHRRHMFVYKKKKKENEILTCITVYVANILIPSKNKTVERAIKQLKKKQY